MLHRKKQPDYILNYTTVPRVRLFIDYFIQYVGTKLFRGTDKSAMWHLDGNVSQ